MIFWLKGGKAFNNQHVHVNSNKDKKKVYQGVKAWQIITIPKKLFKIEKFDNKIIVFEYFLSITEVVIEILK